jgi:hypothetical protein
MTGNKHHRYHKQGVGSGRKKVLIQKEFNYNSRLGGIPMIIRNGKIDYAWKKTKWHKDKESFKEDEERFHLLPQGEGSFIRRHIYETRFGIEDETDEERRRREYKEWWEEGGKV